MLLGLGALRESQTIDEGVHLAAGYSYWRTGDFRMNPEHPPLLKLLASVPLFGLPLQNPAALPAWHVPDQWSFARALLYSTDISPTTVFFLGRLPIMLLTLCLALLIFLWSKKLWGFWGGALSLSLFAFDPNMLAHGHYITTDIGIALFLALSVYFFERTCDRPDKRSAFLLALSVAAAHGTKFSAVLVWMILFALFLHRSMTNPEAMKRVRIGRLTLLVIGVTTLFIFLLYGFRPLQYVRGFVQVFWHNYWGHDSYLWGQTSSTGWWWYFPVAFFVKTPLATLVLLLLSLLAFLRAMPKRWFLHDRFRIIMPALLYFGASMTSSVNLGLRHVLPIYPFLFVFAGLLTHVRFRRFTVAFRAILVSLVVLLATTTLLIAPFFITYFSEIIGGTKNGMNFLVDSNLDWGQGLKELGERVRHRNITKLAIVYFGQAPVETYLPAVTFEDAPRTDERDRIRSFRGWIAISASVLASDPAYAWLRDYEPTERVANSIFLYNL